MENNQSRGLWTSASNAEADSLCPGRFRAQQGLPSTKSADAAFGTELHAAVATGEMDKLSAEQKDLAESCLIIIDRVGEQYFGHNWLSAKANAFVEQRYWAKFRSNTGVEYQHSGQCDRVYRSGPKALIVEIKSLAGTIAGSPENLQLRDQAVLVKGHFVVNEVATVVVQPLVTHSPRVAVYDKGDLVRAEKEMFARIVASHNPGSPRIPGEEQCRFCRAKTKCPEYNRHFGSTLPMTASILDTPIASWDAAQCGAFLAGRVTAQKWLDDAYETIKARLEKKELELTGWKLTDGKDRETIKDPQALYGRFEAIGGKLEQYMECLTVGKTRFENAVHQVTGKVGKALKAQVKTLTEGLVETKKTSPSIERDDK